MEESGSVGRLFLAVVLAAAVQTSPALGSTVVRVAVGDPLAHADTLTPAVRRYVRYLVKPDGQRQLVDLWQRRIETAPLAGHGGRALHMTQRWDEVRDGAVLIQDSWFDAATLAPISHVRRLTKAGVTTVKGYRFGADAVTAMADLPGAINTDFRMPLPERSFNFEYDMELFEALPLAAGMVFEIPFYDAGIDKEPARYRFAVAGSATITGSDGGPVDCWVLTGDYRTGKVTNRFWITKDGHVLVREEGPGWDGGTLVKALLPAESGEAT